MAAIGRSLEQPAAADRQARDPIQRVVDEFLLHAVGMQDVFDHTGLVVGVSGRACRPLVGHRFDAIRCIMRISRPNAIRIRRLHRNQIACGAVEVTQRAGRSGFLNQPIAVVIRTRRGACGRSSQPLSRVTTGQL